MTRVDLSRAIAVVAAAGVWLQAGPAAAQSADAEMLFRDGRALIKHGQLAPGCDKLAASEHLETSVGTLLNLGDCREKLGQLATAWAAFRKAQALAQRTGGDDKRQKEANRRAAQLEPRLANLIVEVPHRVDGLVVKRDDDILDAATWSTAMPVDPGTYTITAEAPGYRPWRTRVAVTATTKREVVDVPAIERLPVARAPEPPIAPVAAPIVVAPTAPVADRPLVTVVRRHPGRWTAMREVSVVTAIAGGAALATGAYFGFRARDLQSQADLRCPMTVCADAGALRLNHDAQTAAMYANVGYVAGGVAVAGALVLWLAGAPSDESVIVPLVGGGQVGATFARRF